MTADVRRRCAASETIDGGQRWKAWTSRRATRRSRRSRSRKSAPRSSRRKLPRAA